MVLYWPSAVAFDWLDDALDQGPEEALDEGPTSAQVAWHYVRVTGITSESLAFRPCHWHFVRVTGTTSESLAIRPSHWHYVRVTDVRWVERAVTDASESWSSH